MAQDEGKEEEKLEFTPEGETRGYISLDQARVLALQHARLGSHTVPPMTFEVALASNSSPSTRWGRLSFARLSVNLARPMPVIS